MVQNDKICYLTRYSRYSHIFYYIEIPFGISRSGKKKENSHLKFLRKLDLKLLYFSFNCLVLSSLAILLEGNIEHERRRIEYRFSGEILNFFGQNFKGKSSRTTKRKRSNIGLFAVTESVHPSKSFFTEFVGINEFRGRIASAKLSIYTSCQLLAQCINRILVVVAATPEVCYP